MGFNPKGLAFAGLLLSAPLIGMNASAQVFQFPSWLNATAEASAFRYPSLNPIKTDPRDETPPFQAFAELPGRATGTVVINEKAIGGKGTSLQHDYVGIGHIENCWFFVTEDMEVEVSWSFLSDTGVLLPETYSFVLLYMDVIGGLAWVNESLHTKKVGSVTVPLLAGYPYVAQCRFIGSGGSGQSFVSITPVPKPACFSDCDGDGFLSFFDFLCFQNAFASGDPYADCDGSGQLDFFDFLCFQNHFAAGCP